MTFLEEALWVTPCSLDADAVTVEYRDSCDRVFAMQGGAVSVSRAMKAPLPIA